MDRPPDTLATAFPDFRFRTPDGHTELAVADAAAGTGTRPSRVTDLLMALCEGPGGTRLARRDIGCIPAAGREWLLQRAAECFGERRNWFEIPCAACGGLFDVEVSLGRSPRTDPGPGFPVAEVVTSLGSRRFEAPNGFHEEALAAKRRQGDPRRVFASLCGLSPEAEAEAIRFDVEDLVRIDRALENVSPDIADGIVTACPDCGQQRAGRIDPLTYAFPTPATVLQEVHLLAGAYGWSETAILDLSVARRSAYATLIRTERHDRHPGRRGQR